MKDMMQTNIHLSNYRVDPTHKTSSLKPALGLIHERVCFQNLIHISTDKQVRFHKHRGTDFQLVDLGPILFAFFISHISSYLIFLSIRIKKMYVLFSYFVLQMLDMYLPHCCSIDWGDGVQG